MQVGFLSFSFLEPEMYAMQALVGRRMCGFSEKKKFKPRICLGGPKFRTIAK
jgi:hypothetical protein